MQVKSFYVFLKLFDLLPDPYFSGLRILSILMLNFLKFEKYATRQLVQRDEICNYQIMIYKYVRKGKVVA